MQWSKIVEEYEKRRVKEMIAEEQKKTKKPFVFR
jgi:hypothetical protein